MRAGQHAGESDDDGREEQASHGATTTAKDEVSARCRPNAVNRITDFV
jgi:hypothetical protein